MTATTDANTSSVPTTARAQIAPPPKTQRRPLLVVASITCPRSIVARTAMTSWLSEPDW